jgi:hypothetical protein
MKLEPEVVIPEGRVSVAKEHPRLGRPNLPDTGAEAGSAQEAVLDVALVDATQLGLTSVPAIDRTDAFATLKEGRAAEVTLLDIAGCVHRAVFGSATVNVVPTPLDELT